MSCKALNPQSLAYAVIFCLLCPVAALHAQQAPSTGQQLIAADQALFADMAGPHPDKQSYADALAPEYLEVEDGNVHSRSEVLDWLAKMTAFTFQYDDPHAVVLSPTTGYVIADVHYSFSFVKRHKLMTTGFMLRDGKWLATLHTEMPITNGRDLVLATPADSNPAVIAMRKLAVEVMSQVHVPRIWSLSLLPCSLRRGNFRFLFQW